MTVLAFSQEHQQYYNEQRNHYQAIAYAYTDWYTHQRKISQTSNCF